MKNEVYNTSKHFKGIMISIAALCVLLWLCGPLVKISFGNLTTPIYATSIFLFIYCITIASRRITIYEDRIESTYSILPFMKKTLLWKDITTVSEQNATDILKQELKRYDMHWRICIKSTAARITYNSTDIERPKNLTLLIAAKLPEYRDMLTEIAAGMDK